MKISAWFQGKETVIEVDHEGKWVILGLTSMSPAEAKALAAALLHYAERAQYERIKGDIGEEVR